MPRFTALPILCLAVMFALAACTRPETSDSAVTPDTIATTEAEILTPPLPKPEHTIEVRDENGSCIYDIKTNSLPEGQDTLRISSEGKLRVVAVNTAADIRIGDDGSTPGVGGGEPKHKPLKASKEHPFRIRNRLNPPDTTRHKISINCCSDITGNTCRNPRPALALYDPSIQPQLISQDSMDAYRESLWVRKDSLGFPLPPPVTGGPIMKVED